jgi:RNA polymerase sigma-70 factor (ECF subfamily)
MTDDLLSNDRALLARFREGERDAMVEVWQAYQPLVANLARRGFGSWSGVTRAADVDDVVSATFVEAFAEPCRQRYDGLTPYGAFLLGIGRNVLRRHLRKSSREPVVEPRAETEPDEGRPSPEEELLGREVRELLGRFPETLPAEEREVFLGYHRQGLSEERLAAVLGRTRHRVRKQLQRAEKRFRKYIRELGLEP